jgi:HD-like signal output (HDOD) protein
MNAIIPAAPARAAAAVDADALILKAATALGVLGGGPHGAQRILALLCNPKVSASQVAEVMAREPGLTLRVLRVANSAFYGAARNVTTIERAFTLLGLDAVRGIAAAACLDRTIRHAGDSAAVDMDALVRHSLATAVAAESLARSRHPALAADAFIAGLLHNLGIAVQLQLDPHGCRELLDALRTMPERTLPELEAQRVQVGHEHCVAVLFEAWQLPPLLVEAARHHHTPLAAPQQHRKLAALVNLGIQLSLACGNTHALEPLVPQRDAAVMALLGLGDEDLDRASAALPERLAQLREALGVPA